MKKIFLLVMLLTVNLSLAKEYCGIRGDIKERISDCEPLQQVGDKTYWKLLTKTKNNAIYFYETTTKLIWSDRLRQSMDYDDAMKTCKKGNPELNDLPNIEWRLPTFDEYNHSKYFNIRQVLPNMKYWFWSSTPVSPHSGNAWVFLGSEDILAPMNEWKHSKYVSVRCVGVWKN